MKDGTTTMGTGTASTPARDTGARIAEILAKELFSGSLQPGAVLPKEPDLVARFGVSRASIRSGLQTLAALGIVRRQAGQGTVVTEYRDWNLLDPLVTRWMVEQGNPDPSFLAEIFEFRRATEPYISGLAARRATARDLLAVEEGFLGMEAAVADAARLGRPVDINAFSVADVDFHAAIYRATHNLMWAQLAHILRPSILLVIRKSNGTADELRDSLERHRHLMECIRLRRPAEAFDAAAHVMSRTGFDLGLAGTAQGDTDLLSLWRDRAVPGLTEPRG